MKFYLFMMPGVAVIFVFHICVPVFSYSPDVSFLMERDPDNYFCGHLQCVADLTKSDHDVFSLVEMTIYDITRVNSDLKLASVSRFHPDLYVDTTKSSAMSCTGIISRHQANLTVQLRHDIDCLYGVYKCQLDVVTASGLSEVLTETLKPELNHNYSRMAEMVSHFSRLTELLNTYTVHVNNQTTQINRLVNQLDDQTTQINRLVNQQDEQTAQIKGLASQSDNQTAQIKGLASESESQTAQINRLVNQQVEQTAQIKGLANQSDNQTAQINRFSSQLDNQTAQLIDLKEQLNNISSRNDLGQADQKQLHAVTQEKLKKFEVKLDTFEKLCNQTAEIFQDQATCIKGQPVKSGLPKVIWLVDIPVLCDSITDGGGWILIQRRTKGDIDFYRNWADYKNGFGTLDTDFWMGNDVIHNLTSQGFNELRVDLIYTNKRYYAHYSSFSIANESMNYRLSVSGYSGTAGDGLNYHNNMKFSTFDRDNDRSASENCAFLYKGAWWYNHCHYSNLNGGWGLAGNRGLRWRTTTGDTSVTFTEMKIRRG